MKDALANTLRTVEILSHKLNPPLEPTIDGWPLYSGLPQPKKEWVGLTDDEIKTAWSQLWYDLNNGKFAASDDPSRHTNVMFARAIEAKLKEKNT
jgi:hypothetical protein